MLTIEKQESYFQKLLLYQSVLPDKMGEILRLILVEDWSFSEIAEQLGISRQAVHAQARRGVELLDGFEEKLNLQAMSLSLLELRDYILQGDKDTACQLVDKLINSSYSDREGAV